MKAEATEARMENELKEILKRRFGKGTVEAQRDFVDLTLTTAERCVLIEIKASEQARRAIRDALGQLLGYAYQKRHGQHAELIIVGRGILTPETRRYLDYLRSRFRLDITYCRYVVGVTDCLWSWPKIVAEESTKSSWQFRQRELAQSSQAGSDSYSSNMATSGVRVIAADGWDTIFRFSFTRFSQ